MISVRSTNDIYVLHNRYAIIRDIFDIHRVVSLIQDPYRELSGRNTSRGLTYTFDRTGAGSFHKVSHNQNVLKQLATHCSDKPTQTILDNLLGYGVIRIEQKESAYTGTAASNFAGLPRRGPGVDNHQLDPQKGGWVIATMTNSGLQFSSKPKVHTTQGAAEAELQRLATVSPGTEFVLMKAVKTAITQTVQTKTFA